MSERGRAAGWVVLAYGVGCAAAFGAGAFTSGGPIMRALAGDLAATCVVFGFSVAFDNSSFYDPYWSVAPPLIGGYWWWQAGATASLRTFATLALVTAWSVRLTYNWARGWRGLSHEDWRYVDIRAGSGRAYWLASFGGIHLFPTAMVFLGCLALYPAVTSREHAFGPLDLFASTLTAAAIAVEAVADRQLHRFCATKSADAIMDRGLWAYSRHPNYFGEVAFWWGLFAFATAAQPSSWWHAVGATAITVMFVFVSIPMMERRSIARRPAYRAYQLAVSRLVPWFPRRDQVH